MMKNNTLLELDNEENESLIYGGILCLGTKESFRFSKCEEKFKAVDFKQRIFQKKFEA